jgi:hypothetical protein
MDYILLSTLVGVETTKLTLSYDIACQWSRNLKARMKQFPTALQLPDSVLNTIKFVIPKCHIEGHGDNCRTTLSLNYLPYSARTDGEDPERWWAHINPVSMSTKEMTAGARHETIDDHAGSWNWRKITNFGESILHCTTAHSHSRTAGKSLLSQLQEACRMQEKHEALLDEFTMSFSPEVIQQWGSAIEAWNEDPLSVNPYKEVEKGKLFDLLGQPHSQNI